MPAGITETLMPWIPGPYAPWRGLTERIFVEVQGRQRRSAKKGSLCATAMVEYILRQETA